MRAHSRPSPRSARKDATPAGAAVAGAAPTAVTVDAFVTATRGGGVMATAAAPAAAVVAFFLAAPAAPAAVDGALTATPVGDGVGTTAAPVAWAVAFVGAPSAAAADATVVTIAAAAFETRLQGRWRERRE